MEKPFLPVAGPFSAGLLPLFSALLKRGLPVLLLAMAALCTHAQVAVNPEDAASAEALSRKYKDDDVICTASHLYFGFDKGKNALGDKVVVIQEDAELDFLSLKKFCKIFLIKYNPTKV